nr:MAG: putative RNA dependent RNA polymerase [Xinjiang mito-like virus 55]
MMNPFIRLGSLLIGKTTRELILGLLPMFNTITRLRKAQSNKGLALFLKASSTYLMKAWSGDPLLDQMAYGPVVGLNRRGIPLWIPLAWRHQISNRNLKVFRVVMTVCNLYRVLDFPGKLKLSTITSSWTGSVPLGMNDFITNHFVPSMITLAPFPRRFSWKPSLLFTRGPGALKQKNTMSGFAYALNGIFKTDMALYFEEYCKIVKLHSQFNNLRIIFEGLKINKDPGSLGKLAFKQEPGKIRVFAMVDCITQWFLQPLHLYLFSVLSKIKQDATFNQERGIQRVIDALSKKDNKSVYSFDLSAATDRLPLIIQICILNSFRAGLGDVWGKILVNRDYVLPKWSGYKKSSSIRYAVGQPMGALSSWAMLAITHHMIVQYCAFSLGYNNWFKEYMVLGDDIVIYDKRVADKYSNTMATLGVGISPTKSLTSSIGVFEFAKRLASPEGFAQGLPLAEFSAARFNINILFQSFRGRSLCPPISLFMRFMGFGYKVLGSLGIPKNIGNPNRRRSLWESVAYAPGLTNKSFSTWSEFYKFVSKDDLYVILEGLIYKAYSLLPSLPSGTRWNLVQTLLPEYQVLDLQKRTVQHLEMMFSNMFNSQVELLENRYSNYLKTLDSTSINISDWTSVDLILGLWSKAPSDLKVAHLVDEDELGVALSVMSFEESNIDLSMSLPIYSVFRTSVLSADAVKWKPPVYFDKYAEFSDVQIID